MVASRFLKLRTSATEQCRTGLMLLIVIASHSVFTLMMTRLSLCTQ
ncbi:hypothetical protein bas02_0082 [Veterinaerplatzvirus Jeanpiccard]|uniref:Uncharacterized protein n=1 Tax=Escherichia phage JeanPiccard TaxID=2851955 RepID=A0AAE8B040_9CAUD|nr:hypothetical protein bas02_0082 [Escherichia phage JeanPiccard]